MAEQQPEIDECDSRAREVPRVPAHSDGTGRWGMLGALGGVATAVAGLFGAIVYVGLSFAAEEVYSPVGVNPSEVGLGYANLLAESALVVALVFAPMIGTALLLPAY